MIIVNLHIWQTLDSLHTDHTTSQIIHSDQTEHKYELAACHPAVLHANVHNSHSFIPHAYVHIHKHAYLSVTKKST